MLGKDKPKIEGNIYLFFLLPSLALWGLTWEFRTSLSSLRACAIYIKLARDESIFRGKINCKITFKVNFYKVEEVENVVVRVSVSPWQINFTCIWRVTNELTKMSNQWFWADKFCVGLLFRAESLRMHLVSHQVKTLVIFHLMLWCTQCFISSDLQV